MLHDYFSSFNQWDHCFLHSTNQIIVFWRKLPTRNLQIRLRLRVRVRVFQCVPGAHGRLREAVTSTRSIVKVLSPSWRQLRDFQKISSPDYEFSTGARRVKRLVVKRADTLWNVPCSLSRNVLATLWLFCCLSTKHSRDWQNVVTSYSQKLLKYFCCELTTATTVSTTAKIQASRAQKSYSYS